MTLNINLEEVPFAILEVVKARILANRRKLQQGQQQPRPSLRPKPQFVKQGASSKGWRLPKQAVLAEESSKKIGVAWFDYQVSGGASLVYDWEVRSGDYSKRLQGSTGYVQQVNEGVPGANYFILPVGGQTGIVVPVLYAFRTDALAFAGAFLVSATTARQIEVPPSLRSILGQLQTNDVFYSSDVGWADPFAFEGEYSPTVFEYLGVGTKQFPVGKRYIERDSRYGILFGGLGGFPEGEPTDRKFYFFEWLGDPNAYEYNEALFLPLPDATVFAPSYVYPPTVSPSFFWDWDDPEYCRQMCLALGFSAADLQP